MTQKNYLVLLALIIGLFVGSAFGYYAAIENTQSNSNKTLEMFINGQALDYHHVMFDNTKLKSTAVSGYKLFDGYYGDELCFIVDPDKQIRCYYPQTDSWKITHTKPGYLPGTILVTYRVKNINFQVYFDDDIDFPEQAG